ncbi:TolC family outer membrane protein [Aestuariispira insulae]|nr:TolC family outer membrane protein [Aestuariispira insulae]
MLVPIMGLLAGGDAAWATSIEEAVRTALQTNPDVGIVAENQRAVGYELEQARAGYRPSVDVTSSTGYQWTNDTTTRAAADQNDGKRYVGLPRYEMGLTLSQMLFDGYATDSAVARQQSRLVSASRRVRETSGQIGLDAIEAYLEALRQRELTELAEVNVSLNERNVSLVERKAQGGAATVADVQQARSRLASAQATLQEAQSRLRDADTTYSRIVGERPKGIVRPDPPAWALPKNLEAAIGLVLSNNPSISVTKADLDTALQDYRGTNSSFWPTLSFELAGNASRNVDGTRGGDYDASALLTMNYNLYNGGADINRRNEFIARIAEARQRYNRVLRVSEEEMRLAWNALDSARERAAVQQREVDANATVSETYRRQFDLGGRNLLELLDAENELFLSKGNLVTTQYLEIFAVYRILSQCGILLSVLNVEPVAEADVPLDPITPVSVDPSLRPEPGGEVEGLLDPDADILDPNAEILDPGADILDPNAEFLDPNADLLGPENDVLDPGADLLDPNAEILDPDADLLDPELDLLSPESEILDPDAFLDEGEGDLIDPSVPGLNAPAPASNPVAPVQPELEILDPNQDMLPPEASLIRPDQSLAGAAFTSAQSSPYSLGAVQPIAPYGLEQPKPLPVRASGADASEGGRPTILTVRAELPYGMFQELPDFEVIGEDPS